MQSPTAARRVLVVDDEADFVEMIAEILSLRGFDVSVAQDPAEARAQLAAHAPQVALLDVRLGRANGIDLLAELRRLAPGLVCMMMTGYADVDSAVRALSEGAYQFLRKPIDPRDLLAALDRGFERARLEAEKAAAEAAVRASERRYRLLAENVLDVILTLDADLRVSYVSPSVTRLTGRAVRTVLEHGLDAIATSSSLAIVRPMLREMLAEAEDAATPPSRTLDLELKRDAGAGRAEVTFSVIRAEEGPLLLGVARDVAERLRAQRETSRLAQVVEQTGDAIIVTEPDGTLVYGNGAFERLTGYSRGEAVGRTPSFLKSGVHDAAFYRDMWTTITAGRTWRGRVTNRCRDGRLVVEDGTISPLRDASGRITAFVSTKRDITREAELEARLARTQRLESIGRLAGGIAHDYNNILVAVNGFADLLRHSPLAEKQQRYVNGIREAAGRAAELTKQILTFSRQGPRERAPLELGGVVREAARLVNGTLPAEVVLRETARGDALVLADPSQLHQVIVNLCTNAALAMRGTGGTLDLEVEEVDVDETMTAVCPPLSPGPHACLTVRDTGCGMTPEVMARIFEPFFTTRPQGEGTGMGLAVVHGIVADHGGAIAVESELGRGSTFRVLLPVVPAPPAAAAEMPAPPPAAARAERVLFVDDDAVQVEVGREMLTELGYRFTGATSGPEALELVRRDPRAFDVVMTDALMPGMSGDSLAAELAAVRADLPILLCSGYGDRAASEKHPPSVRGFLPKPYSLEVLAEALRRALDAPTA